MFRDEHPVGAMPVSPRHLGVAWGSLVISIALQLLTLWSTEARAQDQSQRSRSVLVLGLRHDPMVLLISKHVKQCQVYQDEAARG
jgi:hypothetical protein